MKKIAIVGLFMVLSTLLFAGNEKEIVVKGRVVDLEMRESLAGVEIRNNAGELLTYSDIDGYFEVHLSADNNYTLNFKSLSYQNVQLSAKAIIAGNSLVELRSQP